MDVFTWSYAPNGIMFDHEIFYISIKLIVLNMRYVKLLFSGTVSMTLFSCNLLSPKNLSNDFSWKNIKFTQPFEVHLQYTPEMETDLPKKRKPGFMMPSIVYILIKSIE